MDLEWGTRTAQYAIIDRGVGRKWTTKYRTCTPSGSAGTAYSAIPLTEVEHVPNNSILLYDGYGANKTWTVKNGGRSAASN